MFESVNKISVIENNIFNMEYNNIGIIGIILLIINLRITII